MEDCQGWPRRCEDRGFEGQRLPQGDTWRNVGRASYCLSARVRQSMGLSAALAATALCRRRPADRARQPAQALLLAHTRRILHWRREGEARPTRRPLRAVSLGEASLVYRRDDD